MLFKKERNNNNEKVASEMHCNLKAARRRANSTALLLDKFVLRMHRKFFRAIGQNSDTTDGFGNPDFLYGTYILAIGGYLTCDPSTLNMMVRQILATPMRQNSSVLLLSVSIKELLHPKSATKNATIRLSTLVDWNIVVNKSNSVLGSKRISNVTSCRSVAA